jgi:hypothetical protein
MSEPLTQRRTKSLKAKEKVARNGHYNKKWVRLMTEREVPQLSMCKEKSHLPGKKSQGLKINRK